MNKKMLLYLLAPFLFLTLSGQKSDTIDSNRHISADTTDTNAVYTQNIKAANEVNEQASLILKSGVVELNTDLATKEELASTVKVLQQERELLFTQNNILQKRITRLEKEIGLATVTKDTIPHNNEQPGRINRNSGFSNTVAKR